MISKTERIKGNQNPKIKETLNEINNNSINLSVLVLYTNQTAPYNFLLKWHIEKAGKLQFLLLTFLGVQSYLTDDIPSRVHSTFMNLYQLNSMRGVKDWVTIATLVPEGDILNSCTRSPTNSLTKLKFLGPTTELLGITTVRCIRGGIWEPKNQRESE